MLNPSRKWIRSWIVIGMLLAVRKSGHHLVAIITSASLLPAAFNAAERACSEAPFPYISAVSNQLIPPSKAAFTIAFLSSCWILGKARPNRPLPPPDNSIAPKPMGVT